MTTKEKYNQAAQNLIDFDRKYSSKYVSAQKIQDTKLRPIFPICVALAAVALNVFSLIVTGYLMRKGSNIFLAVLFVIGVIAWICLNHVPSDQKKEYRHIVSEHRRLVAALEALYNQHPELQKTDRWWRIVDGLTFEQDLPYSDFVLTWHSPTRVKTDENGLLYLEKDISGETEIPGQAVLNMMASPDVRVIPIEGVSISAKKTYQFAELTLSGLDSGGYLYESAPKHLSREQINNAMAEYRAKIDNWERLFNLSETNKYETNAESYMYGNKSFLDYVNEGTMRSFYEFNYQEKLRSVTCTDNRACTTTVHQILPVGIIVLGDNGIAALMLYTGEKSMESYETTSVNSGKKSKIVWMNKTSITFEPPHKSVLAKLFYYKLPPMDYTQPRPEGFSAAEWAMWIYAHAVCE